jgi:hypothetical protein
LLAVLIVASCGGGAVVSQTEQVSAAVQAEACDDGGTGCESAADGWTACTLVGATTAGVQGNCAAGLWQPRDLRLPVGVPAGGRRHSAA